jgi:cytochrome c553
MPDPDAKDPTTVPALGHVSVAGNGWVMNCLTCHAGKVDGRVIPGLPNTHLDLQTLIEDVRRTKLRLFKAPAHLDLVSATLPLSTNRGTTNSVVFGIVLGTYRDKHMTVHLDRRPPRLIHHDMDAPPLWNVRHKSALYCDAFAPKNPRVLMQFMLLPTNGPEKLKSWEPAFRDILAWIESLRPPKYTGTIDETLARSGRALFRQHCSSCHGTYGTTRQYPQRIVPLEIIGTDPTRLNALTAEHRQWMKTGWLSRYGKDPVVLEPQGYLAPPLDGIWATAPYFHNGSTPTLWHVLHPGQRPVVWTRKNDSFDHKRIGFVTKEFDTVPVSVTTARQRRRYFDTTKQGKSAAGHLFPDKLSETEKRAVLEFLKTL